MQRKIIHIDEKKCTGCGLCIPNCPEGAIQLIDGKARLISDLFCDGLGACLGHCPEGAITIEEREAIPYDEDKVMENIVKQGTNTIKAHLEHLRSHNEMKLLHQAQEFLKKKGIELPCCCAEEDASEEQDSHGHKEDMHRHQDQHGHAHSHGHQGCPGAKAIDFSEDSEDDVAAGNVASQLKQWPIQMHLISPRAGYFQGKDVLMAADCVAYAVGNFHQSYLKGKSLIIACPKLDEGQEVYVEKITALIDEAKVNTITVMIMEVPCCMGLIRLVQAGAAQARRKVPIKQIMVSLRGEILSEEWISA